MCSATTVDMACSSTVQARHVKAVLHLCPAVSAVTNPTKTFKILSAMNANTHSSLTPAIVNALNVPPPLKAVSHVSKITTTSPKFSVRHVITDAFSTLPPTIARTVICTSRTANLVMPLQVAMINNLQN